MDQLIAIETRQYSAVFSRILTDYAPQSRIKIDRKLYCEQDVSDLLKDWCQNKRILSTTDFEIARDKPIFGFHDHPDELWAAVSELDYVKRLADQGLIRFKVMKVQRGRKLTLKRALGIANGNSPPPDDETVDRWLEERREHKYR